MPRKLLCLGLCLVLTLLSSAVPASASPASHTSSGQAGHITIRPAHPTPADQVSVIISGLWGSSCPVVTYSHCRAGYDIVFNVTVRDLSEIAPVYCCTVITSWAITETLGTLSAGMYTLQANVRGGNAWNFRETVTFTVTSPLPINLAAVEEVYPLDSLTRARLLHDGLVVLGNKEAGYLSEAYMALFDRPGVSVFITSDALLHVYHVIFDDLLQTIEKEHLYSDLQALVTALAQASLMRYNSLPDSQVRGKAAARHAVLFFSVACRLLDESYALPPCVASEAQAYVDKILTATAFEYYPGDDYTQYQPRGHYAGDAQLERYFRAMKWLGRRIFRIIDLQYPQEADKEIVSAALIAQLLQEDYAALSLWQRIYEVTTLLTNVADSIVPPLVWQAVNNVFGASFSLTLLEDTANIGRLRQELQRDIYPSSQIIPVPTLPGQMPPKYIQFMGERYVPDSEAMQETCFPYVAERELPSGLDVADTLLGSDRARELLAAEIARYLELGTRLIALRSQFDAWDENDWTASAYNRWLYTLRPLVAEPDPEANCPPFMTTDAWRDEKVNTVLASWSQLRHDYILYAKTPYGPGTPQTPPSYGYVEPIPEFYARLSALCHELLTELGDRGLLPATHSYSLDLLAAKCDQLAAMARKILAGEPLSQSEQDDIHRFGLWLTLVFADSLGVPEEEPVLVADVATHSPSRRVLYAAVGWFNPILVIYPQPDGQWIAAIGYVMSSYEFDEVLEPGRQRLTDAEWSQRLDSAARPSRPAWTSSFLTLGSASLYRQYLPWVACSH